MKKRFISIASLFLLTMGVVQAQSVADGVKSLNAQRYQGAKATFEKIIAANPNDIDANYWLGQTLLEMKDVAAAKAVYEKALTASSNAPLISVGMGQVDLTQGRINEARQRFEEAITKTASKKSNDPVILNAVGRAITNVYTDKDKKGDINFAIEKLKEASEQKLKDNQLLADIYINLGNALRKARPGEGGGDAYLNYQKAIDTKPDYALGYYKMAGLFEAQKNQELFEKYLNDAIAKDPTFAPAYYDLYYIKFGQRDYAAMQDAATKYIANSDPDPQADHFKAQTYWAEKKYDEAIALSKDIISKAGAATKPRTYSLLADSYMSKGDTATAKQYIDDYMAKQKPEDITAVNYKMKAQIYATLPGQEAVAMESYLKAAEADTVLQGKLDVLRQGADYFKSKKLYAQEAPLRQKYLDLKADPTLSDMFNATLAYYFNTQYPQGRDIALKMEEKFPQEVFGYQWAFNHSRAMADTVNLAAWDSIAAPDAIKLFEFSQKDSVKFKSQFLNASLFLVDYYVNYAKNKDAVKALSYLDRAIGMDPANENYKRIREQLQKAVKSNSSIRKPVAADAQHSAKVTYSMKEKVPV